MGSPSHHGPEARRALSRGFSALTGSSGHLGTTRIRTGLDLALRLTMRCRALTSARSYHGVSKTWSRAPRPTTRVPQASTGSPSHHEDSGASKGSPFHHPGLDGLPVPPRESSTGSPSHHESSRPRRPTTTSPRPGRALRPTTRVPQASTRRALGPITWLRPRGSWGGALSTGSRSHHEDSLQEPLERKRNEP
jgi:hypothetical protein